MKTKKLLYDLPGHADEVSCCPLAWLKIRSILTVSSAQFIQNTSLRVTTVHKILESPGISKIKFKALKSTGIWVAVLENPGMSKKCYL